MIDVIRARIQQKHRTMAYPDGQPPELPERFVGRPVIDSARCNGKCAGLCAAACPYGAINAGGDSDVKQLSLDMGKCIFCKACQDACSRGCISFKREHRVGAARRSDLVLKSGTPFEPEAVKDSITKFFGKSLKLREVSAAGCNACEADTNVLNTVGWDLGRFGIQFVASPRHADGVLVTGPVSQNMKDALLKTYAAVAEPKVVIAVGACAISGGPYAGHPEICNGVSDLLPVDFFVPGCPPHPLSILDGLLRFIGRMQ